MRIVGLTGSIAMGKSTAADMFRRMGVPVHDADLVVHRLLAQPGPALDRISREFPGVIRNGSVDRKALGKIVFADRTALSRLEAILHPLVRAVERQFRARARASRRKVVVLDIPLLFETGAERRCDAVLVVSAPRMVQMRRALDRPGMTKARFAEIEARQMPDARKRQLADVVIPTGLGRRLTWKSLLRALKRS